jgi:hypothetical protein
MRVWDVDPGYLNPQRLLGEHREIHAVYVIIAEGKRGYANHPETLRWRGHLGALAQRHARVVAEMTLRGYRHHSPLPAGQPDDRPERTVDAPARQLAILAAKYETREAGRIPLPSSAQVLWAQHKYSLLARDPARYRQIGATLAKGELGLAELAAELTARLWSPPSAGGLWNALLHMWGYVRPFAAAQSPGEDAGLAGAVLATVQTLAMTNSVSYLVHSTALGEFGCWIGYQGNGEVEP